jgi:hypothetical protein
MEQLALTAFLNRLFGSQVTALLEALHIHPKHPLTPISNSSAGELLVALLLTLSIFVLLLLLVLVLPILLLLLAWVVCLLVNVIYLSRNCPIPFLPVYHPK